MKNKNNFLKRAAIFFFLQLFFLIPFSSRLHWSITAMHLCVNCLFCFNFCIFFYSILNFNRSKLSKRLFCIEVTEPLLKYVGHCVWFWMGDGKVSLCRCSFLRYFSPFFALTFSLSFFHSASLSHSIKLSVCVFHCCGFCLFSCCFFFAACVASAS